MNIDNIIKLTNQSDKMGMCYKLTFLKIFGFNITYMDGDSSGGRHLGFGFCIACLELELTFRIWGGNAA